MRLLAGALVFAALFAASAPANADDRQTVAAGAVANCQGTVITLVMTAHAALASVTCEDVFEFVVAVKKANTWTFQYNEPVENARDLVDSGVSKAEAAEIWRRWTAMGVGVEYPPADAADRASAKAVLQTRLDLNGGGRIVHLAALGPYAFAEVAPSSGGFWTLLALKSGGAWHATPSKGVFGGMNAADLSAAGVPFDVARRLLAQLHQRVSPELRATLLHLAWKNCTPPKALKRLIVDDDYALIKIDCRGDWPVYLIAQRASASWRTIGHLDPWLSRDDPWPPGLPSYYHARFWDFLSDYIKY